MFLIVLLCLSMSINLFAESTKNYYEPVSPMCDEKTSNATVVGVTGLALAYIIQKNWYEPYKKEIHSIQEEFKTLGLSIKQFDEIQYYATNGDPIKVTHYWLSGMNNLTVEQQTSARKKMDRWLALTNKANIALVGKYGLGTIALFFGFPAIKALLGW